MEEIIPIQTTGQLINIETPLVPCSHCRTWGLEYESCVSCGAPAARRPTLQEVYARSGRAGISSTVMGDFELIHRNKDTGALVRKVAYHNIPTWFLQNFWGANYAAGTLNVCISNDEVEQHPRRSAIRATYEGGATAVTQSSAKTLDYAAQTWTYNATFAAPSTESRFISFVGLASAPAWVADGIANAYIAQGLITGKTLTTTEEQTTGNIVEIIYRLTLKKG